MAYQVDRYWVIERDVRPEQGLPSNCPALGLMHKMLRQYHLMLFLHDGFTERRFLINNIIGGVVEPLKRPDCEVAYDLPGLLKAIKTLGRNPLDQVKKVTIDGRLDECSQLCDDHGECFAMRATKSLGENCVLASCPDYHHDNFWGLMQYLHLNDGTTIPIISPQYAVFVAAAFGCGLEFLGHEVQGTDPYALVDINEERASVDPRCLASFNSVLLHLKGTDRTPLFIGLPTYESFYIDHYDFDARTHSMDSHPPPPSYKLLLADVVHLAVRSGEKELRDVVIDDKTIVNEGGRPSVLYGAKARMRGGEHRMNPSDSFLLSRVLGADAFVDPDLLEFQEDLFRKSFGDA